MASSSLATEVRGTRTAADDASDANLQRFILKALLSKVRTSMPVEVKAVTNAGGVSPVGYVDIQPLVQQLDGSGKAIPHGTIFNVPYLRIQGGQNAVILDPQVGDIGLAVFSDRDISAVKSSKGSAPPGSKRRHDMSDAVYLHTIIGGAPTQYVRFYAGGIEAVSPTKIKFSAPTIEMDATTITQSATTINATATNINTNGALTQTGTTALNGNTSVSGTLQNNGTNVGSTHVHGGVQSGSSNSAGPH